MGKNWKKAIAGTLSACLLATCVPERTEFGDFVQTNEVVQAATTKNAISGKCGKKATWKYNTKTKTLTISGSGEMYAYTVYTWYENAKNESPWATYIKEIKKVVVGNKITEIGEYAFYGCTSLKTVSLGKNIKKIQDGAFYGATALEKINLGDKVEKIDYSAFYDCKSLKSLNIGKSVKTINSSALAGCSGLKTIKVSSKNKYFKMKNNSLINKQGTQWYGGCFVTDSTCRINEKIEKIDTGAMERNSSIENIKVSSKNKTFSSKDGLLYLQNGKELFICPQGKKGTVVVQEKTTVIGEDNSDIFKNCAEIEKIIIGKNVEEMEFNTEGCVKLKEIEIAEDNKTYSSAKGSILSKNGLYLLYCVSTDNGTYKIPDGVEFIDDRALNRKFGDGGYSSDDPTILIEHVIFPDSFEDGNLDDGDGDVWIHFKGVKTITLGAKYCDGPNLPWLLEYADRTNLEAVYVSEENPFYASVDGVLYDKEQETLLLCPTKAKICNIPATVISLNEHAFSYRNEPYSLEQLTVSSENQYYKSVDNVLYTKDGSKLLYCPKAKSGAVTVSSGTSIIGEASFSLCKNVTEIIMPGSVTTVEKNAFKGVNEKAVFKVPAGKKAFFEKLLTAENGFGTKMTVKEME